MSDKIFIDTNIWVYAHLEKGNDPKWQRANALIEDEQQRYVISTQVLNEYYSAMLKNKAPDDWIQDNLEAMMQFCDVQLVTLQVVRYAYHIRNRYSFSYWDSLVISSALNAGCSTLYSEDMQHEQIIERRLQVVNPFVI
ncbi:MAG: PIN domain-containing protein [Thiotrichaceae bacterium]|nr:PIN domain-containing protein [Thiotrichaceae bacterium]